MDKALGETAKRFVQVAVDLLAANISFLRTGLGRISANQQGETLAKAPGMFLGHDKIDGRKLLMLVHKLVDEEELVIEADSMLGASVHVATMQELAKSSALSGD